jgi:hypothetical protein
MTKNLQKLDTDERGRVKQHAQKILAALNEL